MKSILTIAGSDSSAGAGIQQDLKTITALGGYGATVITAVTAQNTMGVQAVHPVPAGIVGQQIRSVLSDLDIRAIKIGMIPCLAVAKAIVSELAGHGQRPFIVLDPVMLSTSGTRLMSEDCIGYVVEQLFPLCTLITPNLPEAELLASMPLYRAQGHTYAILQKGGHADSEVMTDVLILPDGSQHVFSSPRIESSNLHGTGCTLSSAIATLLAQGHDLPEAVRLAKDVISRAIADGRDLRVGHGNGPLWVE